MAIFAKLSVTVTYVVISCGSYGAIRDLWLCSHENESRSERRFGPRFKTWLGSWFELRAFTCTANAFPITIRICALPRVIFCSYCAVRADWPMHGFRAHFQNAHARITFRKSFAFTGFLRNHDPKRPFFRVSKASFETALRSQGLKSGFQIRKGPNHVPKRLSERDSFSCEQALCQWRIQARGPQQTRAPSKFWSTIIIFFWGGGCVCIQFEILDPPLYVALIYGVIRGAYGAYWKGVIWTP